MVQKCGIWIKMMLTSIFSLSHNVCKAFFILSTGSSKSRIVAWKVKRQTVVKGEGLNHTIHLPCGRMFTSHHASPFPQYILILTHWRKKTLRKYCGKKWNCSKWAISPFSTMFSMLFVSQNPFIAKFQLSAAYLNLGWSQNGLLGNGLTLHHTILTFNNPEEENIVGKGENAGNQHFLFFHNVFYPIKEKFGNFDHL